MAPFASFAGASGPAFGSDTSAVGLLGGTLADDGPALAAAADFLFAAPTDDTAAGQ